MKKHFHRKLTKWFYLSLALTGLGLTQNGFAGEHEIGSDGYFRFGTGTSQDGGRECFKAPGAGAKYRLGNECDTWLEVGGYHIYHLNEVEKSPYLLTEIMIAATGDDETVIDYEDVVQFFIEMGRFSEVLGSAKIWAGRRYYDRHNIELNDYFPLNLSGDGGGIRDVDVGFGKFAYAYMQEERSPVISDLQDISSKVAHRSHDFRLYNIPTNQNGQLLAFLNYSNIVGRELSGVQNDLETTVNIADANGWSVGFIHKQDKLLGGYNKASIQYGRGAARNAGTTAFESATAMGLLAIPGKASALEEATTFRITNQNVIENPNWAVMSVLIYEKKDHATFDETNQTWMSAGVRPYYFLNEYARLIVELGYDRVKNEATEVAGSVRKLTFAGELAGKRGFWERPVIRAYVTYADWSEGFRGQVGGETYQNDTSGWSAGIQIESWWDRKYNWDRLSNKEN